MFPTNEREIKLTLSFFFSLSFFYKRDVEILSTLRENSSLIFLQIKQTLAVFVTGFNKV